MKELTDTLEKKETTDKDDIRVYLSDWLFNAGVLGFMKIVSLNGEISNKIHVSDDGTYIEFNRDVFEGLTDKFFEAAFKFHGKYDSIVQFLKATQIEIEDCDIDRLAKVFKIENPNEERISYAIIDKIYDPTSGKWRGKTYEKLHQEKFGNKKPAKSDISSLRDVQRQIKSLLQLLESKRETLLQREVQIFLQSIVGKSSFLNITVSKDQKKIFRKDFETPLYKNAIQKDKNFNCIHCNDRKAKKDTIFSTGLVFYQGLNKDSVNFVWGFDPNLPLCEICEMIYFCHWAGFTKGFNGKSYLFVNDDSGIKELWDKNLLLTQELLKNRKENVLINYFYELLVRQEKIKSSYTLQNIPIIEIDLQKEIMPKVISLHISRRKSHFIKDNHEKLKWQSSRFYKIKDDYNNILREFLHLLLNEKLNYRFVNRLLKYYLQSLDETKSFVTVNYSPSNLQQLVVLISEYFKIVKQKSTNMEAKFIWHIYHLGNDMRSELIKQKAQNKINGLAYRLLNAVRANDYGTFLNLLLRLYIGYNKEVPKSLVTTLEGEEKFQTIGHSYINGLLGEAFKEKETSKE